MMKCRIQHQREKHQRQHNDYSSIDRTLVGFTRDSVMSLQQCRSLAKGKLIYQADQFLELTTTQSILL